MATITGLTAAEMNSIAIVSGSVVGGHLILTTKDGGTIDAGSVIGPTGATGPNGTFEAENTHAVTDDPSMYTNGYTVNLVSPAAGWPDSTLYGVVQTVKGFGAGGGTIQYWSSYQTNNESVFYRQWFYNATAWSAWQVLGASPGDVKQTASSHVPLGWLLCDGSAVSRTTYALLYAAIGTTYGTGDGSTTFNLPNTSGRVPAGYDSTQTEFNTLGKTGGEKTHLLTLAEMAAHTHTPDASGNVVRTGSGTAASIAVGGASFVTGASDVSGSAGGGGAHNNLQPYITFNYLIKT
jgi:microcystin-dependent protein